jgi:hypothetical protein
MGNKISRKLGNRLSRRTLGQINAGNGNAKPAVGKQFIVPTGTFVNDGSTSRQLTLPTGEYKS